MIAQRLPPEILLSIFNNIPRVRAKPSSYITGQVDPMRGIPRVCKSWYLPGTEVLYKFVCVPRVAAVLQFHKTLIATSSIVPTPPSGAKQRKSRLGSLVKILLLPKRVWDGCPESLVMLFARVIDLCDSLEEIQVICNLTQDSRFPHQLPIYPLPLPINKHSNLKIIALANADNHLYTNFPFNPARFPCLEELCLSGFRISTEVNPEDLQVLPKLKMARFESCDIGRLEEWLIRCPQLTRLEFDLSNWVVQHGGILEKNTLRVLQWSRSLNPVRLSHISECNNLIALTIDYNTFNQQWDLIPISIIHLSILFKESDTPDTELFKKFAVCGPPILRVALKFLLLRISRTHPWIVENQSRLEEQFKEKGVAVTLDLTKFGPRMYSCFCLDLLILIPSL